MPLGPSCHKELLNWRQRDRRECEYVMRTVTDAGARGGVPRVYPHLLRHPFAALFLIDRLGGTLRRQQILGHERLEMVRSTRVGPPSR